MVTKFNVSMSPALFERLEKACSEMGVTRSAFIAFAVSTQLATNEFMRNFPEAVKQIKPLSPIDELETEN